MKPEIFLFNCFLLLIPIICWNGIFFKKISKTLPTDKYVTHWLLEMENGFRFLLFIFPLFIPIRFSEPTYIPGLIIYFIGCLIYFISWLPHLINQPRTKRFSQSASVFLGPFITPLFFLVGITLVGKSTVYGVISLLFICVHTYHGLLLYKQHALKS